MKKEDLNLPSRVVYEHYIGENQLAFTVGFVLDTFRESTEYRQRIVSRISYDYNSDVDDLCDDYLPLAKILRTLDIQFEAIADLILEHKAVRRALEEEKKKAMILLEDIK